MPDEKLLKENEFYWFILQVVNGCEIAARDNILGRRVSLDKEEFISDVFVPVKIEQVEKLNRQTKLKEFITKERIVFDGYVYIRMKPTFETIGMVRNTPLVTGIYGMSGKGAEPVPVPEIDVNRLMNVYGKRGDVEPIVIEKRKIVVGDRVKIIDKQDFNYEKEGIVKIVGNNNRVFIEIEGIQFTTDHNIDDVELVKNQS